MKKIIVALLFCFFAIAASASQVLTQWGQDNSGTTRNVYILDPTDNTWIAIGAFNTNTDMWQPVSGSVPCASLPAFSGVIQTSAGSCVTSFAAPVGPANGGTGVANPTAHAIALAEGSANFNFLAPVAAGDLPVDQGPGNDPIFKAVSGDCSFASSGAITCTKTGGVLFGALATLTPGTGVATALGNALNASGGVVGYSGSLGTPSSGTATHLTGLPLTTGVSGVLPIANGGTATTTPSLIGGTNVTVTGAWPNQTINSSGGTVNSGGGGIVPTSGTNTTLYQEQMTPGGRLTVASGVCVPVTDQVAQTSIYYAPCGSEWVPIYNGTQMQLYQFTSSATDTVGLALALGSNWSANTLYDAFVALNSGAPVLCTGPAWSSSAVGSSTRGSGSGTTQLALYKGLWTNAVSLTCRISNSATITAPANEATYVGTFLTNASAGQIDLKFGTAATGCGSAVLSVFNAYNRHETRATVINTTATWNYTTAAWRAADASSTCVVNQVTGLGPEDVVWVNYAEFIEPAASSFGIIGVGFNTSTSIAARSTSFIVVNGTSTGGENGIASFEDVPVLGLNQFFAIEQGNGTSATQFNGQGTFNNMQLSFKGQM